MIVREPPSALKLFFVMQGSIVPKITSRIIGVALLTAVVLLVDHHVIVLPRISMAAMGIFGVALSLFLGFRNNAAYDRWWEARKLWGAIIADLRNLGRHLSIFVREGGDRAEILSLGVAFSHLHRGSLRDVDVSAEISGWIGETQSKALIAHTNPADAALRAMADQIGTLGESGAINGFGQMSISDTLSSLALSQAGCERIATTPLPFVYSLMVRRTTYLYCWLLPFALIGGFLNGPLHLGVLPLLYGFTMWLTTAMNPPATDPIQQRIFQLMPIMFTFIMAPFAAGLLIYWTWNNVLTIGQQYIIMRKFKVDNPIDSLIARFKGKKAAS